MTWKLEPNRSGRIHLESRQARLWPRRNSSSEADVVGAIKHWTTMIAINSTVEAMSTEALTTSE